MQITSYPDLLKALLVSEWGKTPERAKELIHDNPVIVTQGILNGNQSLRGAAMALDQIDADSNANE